MKRAKSKFSKSVPKLQGGGSTYGDEYGGGLRFKDTRQGKTLSSYDKDKQLVMDTTSQVGAALPGYGQLIALGVYGAQNADKEATDEFGINKNELNTVGRYAFGTEALDTVFSQQQRLMEGDVKGFTGDALSLGTMGLYKSTAQREREKARNTFRKIQKSNQMENTANQGALAYNTMYPQYKAPAYGRNGMKLKHKTKFSKI